MTRASHTLPANRWTTLVDGQHLRNSRNQHGLTRDQLASKTGISVTTIARLERHPRSPCRSRTLARLAAALGEQPTALTPEPHLLQGQGVPPP
jgi:transcriptional regulator with XRE-family HTH domain